MALISCPSCGAPMSDQAAACPKCGASAPVVCAECGAQVTGNNKNCPNCGAPVVRSAQPAAPQQNYSAPQVPSGKDKTVAGILALFLGGLGIDLFYCGKTKAGLVVLLIAVLLCWTGIANLALCVLALIRGIRMLTQTKEEFEQRYVYTDNEWPIV